MTDKIKSIAELRRRVDKLTGDPEIYRKDVEDLIAKFEASVRERINKIDWPRGKDTRIDELRRILGEGNLLRRAEREAAEVKRLSGKVLARVRGEE